MLAVSITSGVGLFPLTFGIQNALITQILFHKAWASLYAKEDKFAGEGRVIKGVMLRFGGRGMDIVNGYKWQK